MMCIYLFVLENYEMTEMRIFNQPLYSCIPVTCLWYALRHDSASNNDNTNINNIDIRFRMVAGEFMHAV